MYFCHMQSDEVRIAKEVEAHEKRIRKEIEKQDILRRKVLLYCLNFKISLWYVQYPVLKQNYQSLERRTNAEGNGET